MERMVTRLDADEAGRVRSLMVEERRSESAMLRVLVAEALDGRSAGGHGGWADDARREPVPRAGGASDPYGVRPERRPTVASMPHEFRAQKTSPLKCAECGGKAGEHRG